MKLLLWMRFRCEPYYHAVICKYRSQASSKLAVSSSCAETTVVCSILLEETQRIC